MQLVNFLAQAWGISLIIISFSILLHPKYINLFFSLIEEEKNVLVFGVINVIAGVMLVLSYNVWQMQWQLAVTILGWLVLIRGVGLLLIPITLISIAQGVRRANCIQPVLIVLLSLGCWLVYMGVTY